MQDCFIYLEAEVDDRGWHSSSLERGISVTRKGQLTSELKLQYFFL